MLILKKIFIDFIIHPKQNILSILMTIIMSIATIVFASSLYNNYEKNLITYFPDDILYIDQLVTESNSYEVEHTISLNSQIELQQSIELDDVHTDLNKLVPIAETSDELLKTIMIKMQVDQTLIDYRYVLNYNSQLINEVIVPSETYNINKILVGKYPYEQNQILIPETLALAVVNDNNFKSYAELIDYQVNYQSEVYYISGVYSVGNNDDNGQYIIGYANDSNENVQTASFVKVWDETIKNKMKNEYEIVISSDDNALNLSPLFLVITYIIIFIMYFTLNQVNIRNTKKLLNHYNHQILNNYPYIVIFMIFNVVYLILYLILF